MAASDLPKVLLNILHDCTDFYIHVHRLKNQTFYQGTMAGIAVYITDNVLSTFRLGPTDKRLK